MDDVTGDLKNETIFVEWKDIDQKVLQSVQFCFDGKQHHSTSISHELLKEKDIVHIYFYTCQQTEGEENKLMIGNYISLFPFFIIKNYHIYEHINLL